MSGFFTRFIVTFFALGFTTALMPGIRLAGGNAMADMLALGAAALVLGALNAVVRPVLIFLTLPLTIVTLGLFILILNGLLLWLTAAVVPAFQVSGFGWAVLATIVLSIISALLNAFVRDKRERG
ncbi:MAG: phage holin family protein [Candidatus Eisenbacteria bacterium]